METWSLVFDEDTELHIWERHRVTPGEAQEAAYQGWIIRGRMRGFYEVYGRTDSGRYLTVVVRYLGKLEAGMITARDMTQTERRRYLRHTAH